MTDRLDLAQLLADPAAVPVEAIPAVIGQLERLKTVLWARLATPTYDSNSDEDQLLTISQAAARLGVPEGWLKKRPDLPFRVVLAEGTVRYSAHGIAAYIRKRSGTG